MAVSSTMLALGTPAPAFALEDVRSGNTVQLGDFTGRALLVMFLCNHCPYVVHVRAGLVALANDYADRDLDIVAISSNDPERYPDDAPERLAEVADLHHYPFPMLFDADQSVAAAYTAACTPDFFLFGPERTLVYRGRMDASRPGSDVPVTGEELRAAIDAVLAGTPAPADQYPSMGCSIKWKPGNEPPYFG